jgi:long-chain acyl-CoA synthetase
MVPFMAHDSLRRVLQSLITATYASQRAHSSNTVAAGGSWKDDFSLIGSEASALGCDSLDLLQISAAVNEMFHLHEVGLETELLRLASFGEWLSIIEDAWQHGVQHLTVTTSGSTGIPKGCTHVFSTLALEIDFLAGLFSGRSRIVAFTPAHHLYGLLFTAMLPDRLACPVQDFLHAANSSTSLGQTTLQAGDLVVSFPQGWEWLNQSIRVIPTNVEGVVSTAPCPPELIESLVSSKLSGFTEVYGSSETAGIGIRTWPETTYSLMPQWSRKRSGDPAPEKLQHSSGFEIKLMDDLEFFADGTFLVQGRKDSSVQVGGVNVFPVLIAQRLTTYPGVAEASVRLMRPEEGKRLKCFVVPQAGCTTDILVTLLREWIESWPIAADRPKTIKVGSALPRSTSGKNSDWE